MSDQSSITVLVTGANGFIATHCILQLLQRGYRVRGTLRNLARQAEIRQMLASHVDAGDRLEFVGVDLLKDDGWDAAVRGCEFVLHVASPVPVVEPKNEDDLILPARDGTLRVLRAAAANGVRRVVYTSSIAAVFEGYTTRKHTFDESNWSNLDEKIGAYARSKTLAERAGWEFVKNLKATQSIELAVIIPGYVLGPCLSADVTTSGQLIYRLLRGEVPGIPQMYWPIVDVRDVAAAHIAAMTASEAAGQRFCCAGESYWAQDVAQILARHFAGKNYKITTRQIPDLFMRLIALVDPTTRLSINWLGREYTLANAKLKTTLGWSPRSLDETVIEMAESMISLGMVRK